MSRTLSPLIDAPNVYPAREMQFVHGGMCLESEKVGQERLRAFFYASYSGVDPVIYRVKRRSEEKVDELSIVCAFKIDKQRHKTGLKTVKALFRPFFRAD